MKQNQIAKFVWILAVIGFILLPLIACFAGTPKQQAVAALAVVQAGLDLADQKPDLKDTARTQSAPPALPSEVQPLVPLPEDFPAAVSSDRLPVKEMSADSSSGGGEAHLGREMAVEPMRIQWDSLAQTASPRALATATVYTGELIHGKGWCVNCPQLKRNYRTGNDRLQILYSEDVAPGEQIYPAIRFVDDDGVTRFPSRPDRRGNQVYFTPQSVDELADLIERNTTQHHAGYAASGSAGTIHAKAQVKQSIDQFRRWIGEGNTASFSWDRNGNPSFGLMHGLEWTALEMFGSEGRFSFDWPDSPQMPVKEFAFGYRVVGRDVLVRADEFRVPGMADKLSLKKQVQASGQTYGIIGIDDVLELYWIGGMLRDLFSLLSPSVDLMMPNQVACTAVLNGDVLTVDFQKPATVKAVWIFTFNLVVKRIVVNLPESKIHVDVSGSRFIKSREFSLN